MIELSELLQENFATATGRHSIDLGCARVYTSCNPDACSRIMEIIDGHCADPESFEYRLAGGEPDGPFMPYGVVVFADKQTAMLVEAEEYEQFQLVKLTQPMSREQLLMLMAASNRAASWGLNIGTSQGHQKARSELRSWLAGTGNLGAV